MRAAAGTDRGVAKAVLRLYWSVLTRAQVASLKRARLWACCAAVARINYVDLDEQTTPDDCDPAGGVVIGGDGPAPGLRAANVTSGNVLSLLTIPSQMAAAGLACLDIDESSLVLRDGRWQLCNPESIYIMGERIPWVGDDAPPGCDTDLAHHYLVAHHDAQVLAMTHALLVTVAKAIDPTYTHGSWSCVDAAVMLPSVVALHMYRDMWMAFYAAWPRHATTIAAYTNVGNEK
ncbi:MAG: hypothetical protein ACPGR8_16480 [Limisphaerales bacterium]